MATSGYSTLTDSQLFFGSQLWLENSQGASQDVSLSSKNSQQSSQEGSEPKLINSYHTKPLLFGDFKDKSRTFGLLEKFEEDRKKAKEKNDSDRFAKEFQHIRETLIGIQQLITGTERNTAVCQTVFEKLDIFTSVLQNTLEGLQTDISQKFEILVDKLSSQKELMTELEQRVKKHADTTLELESYLQSLKKSLESLREENKGEGEIPEEALKLLSSLVLKHSAKLSPKEVMDSAVQTSPELKQFVSKNLQDKELADTQLTCASFNPEHHQVEASLQVHEYGFRKRRVTLKGKKRRKKRAKSSKLSVSNENTRPVKKCNKLKKTSKPLHERCDQNAGTSQDSFSPESLRQVNKGGRFDGAVGCFINPLSWWSQDSNSSECLVGIEPFLEKLSAESKTATPVKPAEFWQLFDSDLDF